MAEGGVSVERHFAAPRDLVWALLSDTNRYDRALGFNAGSYGWREVDGQRRLVGQASQGGMKLSWFEEPYQWIEGRMLSSLRIFITGPAKSGGIRLELEDEEDGCRARLTAHGESGSWILKLIDPLVRAHLRRRITAYMDATAELVEKTIASTPLDPEQPPALRVQALLAQVDNELASGGRSPTDRAELERRAARLEAAPVDREVARALVQALELRPDEEVSQMRPFQLARHWGHDRYRVLRAFLHATQAGLVDLSWQINCPVCRVSAQVVDSLGEVGRDVHCEACNIRYDVDFGASVEAVFRCNQAIRDVQPATYCAASPSFRPHVLAQLRVEPGDGHTHRMPLTDGHLHLRTLGDQRPADLADDHAPAELHVTIGPEGITARAEGRAEGEATTLHLRSELDEPAYLLVERGGWSADAVLGSVVASQPDFVDLFATEAPAAGLDLTIGRITLLFSDLTGSTALYERIGDAKAYAVVQEHFRLMEETIARNGGAVIKTMGDAVMASFVTPADAVTAAIEAVKEAEAQHGEHGVGVKLGIHEGPCLAVRANERLDFFGTTVNLAARLQGQAGAGELVVMQALADLPVVAERLEGFSRRAMTAHLKGISEDQPLVGIDLRGKPEG